MIWFNGWMKELILIILIASFVDLLLPNHAMQRYVKTVIGLFLLLVLLSPVFQLFQKNWDINKLLTVATRIQNDQESKEFQPLFAIMQQSNKLSLDNQRQAKQLLEEQLTVTMKEGIERLEEGPVHNIKVHTKINEQGKPVLVNVDVLLGRKQEKLTTKEAVNDSTVKPMQTIQPVSTIRPVQAVKPNQTDPSSLRRHSVISDPKIEQDNLNRKARIKLYFIQEWLLKETQIKLVLENQG